MRLYARRIPLRTLSERSVSSSQDLSPEQRVITDILLPSEFAYKERLHNLPVCSFACYASWETACPLLQLY